MGRAVKKCKLTGGETRMLLKGLSVQIIWHNKVHCNLMISLKV